MSKQQQPVSWEELMRIFSKDVNVLKYNVFDPEKQESIYKIESFREFKSPKKWEIIRYIVLLYDRNSPLIKQFKDINLRQMEAARAAGLDLELDKFFLDELNSFTNSIYTDLVMDFLIDQNEYWWTMIISNEFTFYEYQKTLLQGIKDFSGDKDKLTATSVKSKLLEDSDKIATRLEAYYEKVFNNADLAKKAQSRHAFTPEKMASDNNV